MSDSMSPSRPRSLNLDNFLQVAARPNGVILSSPRSIEVCRSNGIEPQELLPRALSSFRQQGGLPEPLVRRRFDHYEDKRQQKLVFLREARMELVSNPEPVVEPSPARCATPRLGSEANGSAARRRIVQQANLEEEKQRSAKKYEQIVQNCATAVELAEQRKEQALLEKRIVQQEHLDEIACVNERQKQKEVELQEMAQLRLEIKEQEKSADLIDKLIKRDWEKAHLHEARAEHRQITLQRAKEETESKNDQVLQKARETSFRMAEAHEKLKADMEANKARIREYNEYVASVGSYGTEIKEMEKRVKMERLIEKELRAQERLEKQQSEETERLIEKEYLSQLQQEEAAARAKSIEQERTVTLEQYLEVKDQNIEELKKLTEMEQLVERELRREEREDRVEEVTRKRKADDYNRHQYFSKKLLI